MLTLQNVKFEMSEYSNLTYVVKKVLSYWFYKSMNSAKRGGKKIAESVLIFWQVFIFENINFLSPLIYYWDYW